MHPNHKSACVFPVCYLKEEYGIKFFSARRDRRVLYAIAVKVCHCQSLPQPY